jgi:hypothetical protein
MEPRLGIKRPKIEFNGRRVLPLAALTDARAEDDYFEVPVGASMHRVYEMLYERKYQFVRRHDSRIALFDPSLPEDAGFLDAALGGFPASGIFSQMRDSYIGALDPKRITATASTWEEAIARGYDSPLDATLEGLERDLTGSDEPILFVVNPASPLDLVDLWNLRLFRGKVIPINLRWFNELVAAMKSFVLLHRRPLRYNPQGLHTHTTIQFGRSIGNDAAGTLLEAAHFGDLPAGAVSCKLWYDSIWHQYDDDDFIFRHRRSRFTAASQDLELTPSRARGDHYLRFSSIAPSFVSSYSNAPFAWVNVLRFNSAHDTSGLALDLPLDFDSDETQRWRLGNPLLSSREGLVLPQRFPKHGEYLELPTGRQAIILWLKQHGLTAELSNAGKVAEQVVGSFSYGLRGARLLAHRETIEELDAMAKSLRSFDDGSVEEYQDRTREASRWNSLLEKRRSTSLMGSSVSLDRFIEANILKLGLSIACPHCTNVNWFAIDNLRESLTCDRCRKEYPIPEGRLPFEKGTWRYRVVGPFAVPNFAEGAYSTILTLRVFLETLDTGFSSSITYAPGLLLNDGEPSPIEVDFTLWYRRERMMDDLSETQVVFGECKSFATESFRDKDIERMRRVASRFPGAFLVFSVFKESLSESERQLIGELARWGRMRLDDGTQRAPVIVLTGTELFSDWYLSETWKKLVGIRQTLVERGHLHFDNLRTLADATQQSYLGLPSMADEMGRELRRLAVADATAAQGATPPP